MQDLLFNNITNARDILSLKKLLGLDVKFNTVFVLTIDNNYSLTLNKSELKKQELRLNVMAALEKMAAEVGMYVLNISEDLFAILLRTEQAGILDLRKSIKIAQIIIKHVQKAVGINVSIGIGRPYRDIQNIHLSYKEALSACSRKFFSGGGQVIHISQIVPYQEDLEVFSDEMGSELTINILSCNTDAAAKLLEEFLTQSEKLENLNPLLLKTKLIELTTLMIKVALETGASSQRLSEISGETVRLLMQADTIHELTSIIKKTIAGITQEVSATRKKKNLSSFENAIKFIHENYHRQITLEDAASHVYLNVFYFSHGFKSFTGLSFIDYLTRVRIEEAKKMLLAGEASISSVAKKVGYLNTNYFGRLFKSIVGVPPSKFNPGNGAGEQSKR